MQYSAQGPNSITESLYFHSLSDMKQQKTETQIAAIGELRKITKFKNMSLETKTKFIYTFVFPTTMCRCDSWTVKKADRE